MEVESSETHSDSLQNEGGVLHLKTHYSIEGGGPVKKASEFNQDTHKSVQPLSNQFIGFALPPKPSTPKNPSLKNKVINFSKYTKNTLKCNIVEENKMDKVESDNHEIIKDEEDIQEEEPDLNGSEVLCSPSPKSHRIKSQPRVVLKPLAVPPSLLPVTQPKRLRKRTKQPQPPSHLGIPRETRGRRKDLSELFSDSDSIEDDGDEDLMIDRPKCNIPHQYVDIQGPSRYREVMSFLFGKSNSQVPLLDKPCQKAHLRSRTKSLSFDLPIRAYPTETYPFVSLVPVVKPTDRKVPKSRLSPMISEGEWCRHPMPSVTADHKGRAEPNWDEMTEARTRLYKGSSLLHYAARHLPLPLFCETLTRQLPVVPNALGQTAFDWASTDEKKAALVIVYGRPDGTLSDFPVLIQGVLDRLLYQFCCQSSYVELPKKWNESTRSAFLSKYRPVHFLISADTRKEAVLPPPAAPLLLPPPDPRDEIRATMGLRTRKRSQKAMAMQNIQDKPPPLVVKRKAKKASTKKPAITTVSTEPVSLNEVFPNPPQESPSLPPLLSLSTPVTLPPSITSTKPFQPPVKLSNPLPTIPAQAPENQQPELQPPLDSTTPFAVLITPFKRSRSTARKVSHSTHPSFLPPLPVDYKPTLVSTYYTPPNVPKLPHGFVIVYVGSKPADSELHHKPPSHSHRPSTVSVVEPAVAQIKMLKEKARKQALIDAAKRELAEEARMEKRKAKEQRRLERREKEKKRAALRLELIEKARREAEKAAMELANKEYRSPEPTLSYDVDVGLTLDMSDEVNEKVPNTLKEIKDTKNKFKLSSSFKPIPKATKIERKQEVVKKSKVASISSRRRQLADKLAKPTLPSHESHEPYDPPFEPERTVCCPRFAFIFQWPEPKTEEPPVVIGRNPFYFRPLKSLSFGKPVVQEPEVLTSKQRKFLSLHSSEEISRPGPMPNQYVVFHEKPLRFIHKTIQQIEAALTRKPKLQTPKRKVERAKAKVRKDHHHHPSRPNPSKKVIPPDDGLGHFEVGAPMSSPVISSLLDCLHDSNVESTPQGLELTDMKQDAEKEEEKIELDIKAKEKTGEKKEPVEKKTGIIEDKEEQKEETGKTILEERDTDVDKEKVKPKILESKKEKEEKVCEEKLEQKNVANEEKKKHEKSKEEKDNDESKESKKHDKRKEKKKEHQKKEKKRTTEPGEAPPLASSYHEMSKKRHKSRNHHSSDKHKHDSSSRKRSSSDRHRSHRDYDLEGYDRDSNYHRSHERSRKYENRGIMGYIYCLFYNKCGVLINFR